MNVKTLCLGILSFGDATGYEIKKMSQDDRFSHFVDASFSAIYPALVRLTKEGLVSCRREKQSNRPDRKVYSITDAGRAAFAEALDAEPAPDKFKSEFLFLMMCGQMLSRERIARALDERILHFDGKITHLNDAKTQCDHPGGQFVIGYALAMYEAVRAYLMEHRAAALHLAAGDDLPDAAE